MSHRRACGRLTLGLALLLVACDAHEPVSVPPGAPEVRVDVTNERLTLAPSAVPAGEVYLVIEGPGQAVVLVSHKASPEEASGPMDAAQVERVQRGDLQSTANELFQVSCGPEAWTKEAGWDGCGNVFPLTLSPGLYVVSAPGGRPGAVVPTAVLEVQP